MMNNHPFNFEGGELLTVMGATWFVSYKYHKEVDCNHNNYMKVKTYKNRISVYDNNLQYHTFWLQKVLEMNDSKLNTNRIGLRADKTKQLEKILLERIS